MNNHMSPLPRPTHDHKHDLLLPTTESQKHALSPPDSSIGAFDRSDRLLKLPLCPPPAYAPARDGGLSLYRPEAAELAPIKSAADEKHETRFRGDGKGSSNRNSNRTLPSLSSITAPSARSSSSSSSSPPAQYTASSQRSPKTAYPPPAPPPLTHWPSLNPLTAYYTPSHVEDPEPPLKMELDTSSGGTPDRFQDGRASSVSLDDPDVRMAAEALGDLKADFISSPIPRSTPPRSPRSLAMGQQPEPLLSLLTTSHPFLATTIDSATSAYTSSKNYYPRFKTSIEYVEGCVIPIANTVGSVGRATGVENGVRWFLRRAQPHGDELEGRGSNKRRKVGTGDGGYRDMTPEPPSGSQTPRASMESSNGRRSSVTSTVDSLPAYDEFRSPPYAEHMPGSDGRPHSGAWQSRLIMSTSGLSIAMSEESLRSLKYCLGWLRWANVHIGNVVNSLTITMEKYERSHEPNGDHKMEGNPSHESEDRDQLVVKIGLFRSDVLKTLQDAINTVSRYAGGALPENARELVRRHLTSLPQRFYLAAMAREREEGAARTESNVEEGRQGEEQREETQTRESARRVLLLAKEGLDMMSQVSGVLNGTIVSAEEWCERLGRKKREQREELLGISHPPLDDIKSG
ncbi:putative clock controlled protein [Rosellinia necatrix]|uniref:Putative clock controlled protein n=1 Tax=Rosellinia necatrix TaxID=77044 RepID=A0A1W2TR47_ROSNE|nr:putative clock controlled protein [Rosellinia necatrix]